VIELIDSVLDILRQNRSNCEIVFHKIFDQAKNECEKRDAPLQARSHGRGDSGAVPPKISCFNRAPLKCILPLQDSNPNYGPVPLLIPRRCKSQIFRDNYILLMTLSIFFEKPYLYLI